MTFAEFNQRWGRLGPAFPAEISRALQKAARLVQRTSQEKYLTGPRPLRLGVVTGRLRRSIETKVEVNGTRVEALIGTNVEYARIHEYGGGISRRGGFLGGQLGVRGATRTTGRMPARPFLAPAIRDQQQETIRLVHKATVDFIARTLRGAL